MAAALLLPPAALAVLMLAWRGRLWLRGGPDPAFAGLRDLAAGLARMPRRYLVDVHHAVARRRSPASMHVLAAGGTVAALPLILAVHWFEAPAAASIALCAATVSMLLGAAVDQWRRIAAGGHLSRGAYAFVPAVLGGFALFQLAALAASAGLVEAPGWRTHAGVGFAAFGLVASFALVFGFAFGPLRHASLGALHLAFHPRPDRFGRPSAVGGMRALDLVAPEPGIAAAGDFTWTELLSFDACVQCGRCEEVCPAFAAGQPLNPKPLIVRLAQRAGVPEPYAGAGWPEPDGSLTPAADGLVPHDTLWSCTTCGACVQACPMLIEHVDAIVGMRRAASLRVGSMPAAVAQAVELSRVRGNLTGDDPDRRWEWIADLGVKVLEPGQETDILLWLGQGAFDARHRRVLRALVEVLRGSGRDFAVLGAAESDCGDIACRAGDEHALATLAAANIAALRARRFNRIVSADPHVVHTIRNEYPRFGGLFPCIHHSTLLAELIEAKAIAPRRANGAFTFHDPCYLARYAGETDAPAAVLDAVVADRRKPERSGLDTFCCGAGGGAALADIPGRERIADIRMRQLRATGADTIVVGCPNCAAMLEGVPSAGVRIADLAEVVEAATRVGP